MKKYNTFLLWILGIIMAVTIAAATKQVIGPTTVTTDNAIVRWDGTSSYKIQNSVVTIDDLGNMAGLASQTTTDFNAISGTVSNGVIYLMKDAAPTAADIGGTVGSITNYMIRNVNGQLISYWSDGTTIYSKTLAP